MIIIARSILVMQNIFIILFDTLNLHKLLKSEADYQFLWA